MTRGHNGIGFATNDIGIEIESSSSTLSGDEKAENETQRERESYLSRTFNELVVFCEEMFPGQEQTTRNVREIGKDRDAPLRAIPLRLTAMIARSNISLLAT